MPRLAPEQRSPTDLTAAQWAILQPLVDSGRKRKHPLRTIVNALLSLDRTGCQWRMLPREYPPPSSVWYSFSLWTYDGTFARLPARLRELDREREGRGTVNPAPRSSTVRA